MKSMTTSQAKFRRACVPAKAVKFDDEMIGGGGRSLHWPEIDEDLSVAGLMAGVICKEQKTISNGDTVCTQFIN